MEYRHNRDLSSFARSLRRDMTKEERHLWFDFLRTYPVKFYRQRVIGNYIVDFYCAAAKIVVELDGSQHYIDAGPEKDRERTKYLESCGLAVIRIPNNEVNGNFRSVCEHIDNIVRLRTK